MKPVRKDSGSSLRSKTRETNFVPYPSGRLDKIDYYPNTTQRKSPLYENFYGESRLECGEGVRRFLPDP